MRILFAFLLSVIPFQIMMGADSAGQLSPVERRIEAAQKRLQSVPQCWQCYNDLAAAFCRKARDTGELSVYDQAQAALDHSFQLSPRNFEASKLEATILLGKHQVAQALKLATELNGKTHDDLGAWALLVEANIALGNNKEALRDAQWILDLRPGSSLGFEEAAELRVIYGDPEGAIEFFAEADRRTSANDADQHAWLLTKSAQQELARVKIEASERLIQEAQKWYPDSQFAKAVLAQIRIAQGKHDGAASLRAEGSR
jgi:tetratricopeptide (TPR) repeat protein